MNPGDRRVLENRVSNEIPTPSQGYQRNERPRVGGVSISSKNGAPSRVGCVVNGPMT